VRYELISLNVIQVNFRLQDRDMAQAVGLWPLTAESWVQSRAIPCEVCDGQSGS
jgi:hypothetical protein